MNHTSTSTPDTSKQKTWKARFSSGRRRHSAGGEEEAFNNYVEQQAEVQQQPTQSSLSMQRGKSKKNWKGSLRNLLPPSKKESDGGGSNPQTPDAEHADNIALDSMYQWQDTNEQTRAREMMQRKQQTKERDGFCRRVDAYDGQILTVDGKPCYELGNYLGGGVAGVVYEGNRLLPSTEYPVRLGITVEEVPIQMIIPQQTHVASFMCGHPSQVDFEEHQRSEMTLSSKATNNSLLTTEDQQPEAINANLDKMAMDVAIETTASNMDNAVFVDRLDAPSRSKHAAKAVASASQWFMEETVAIKILNPVGFRILTPDATQNAVVVKEGEAMPRDVALGKAPMQNTHVWWLVNPNSRNLQTLQRYNAKRQDGSLKKSRDVDRGSPDRGLRLSLVAAFMDTTGQLRELPLTRCIEIWGHVPFDATDLEFEDMLEAIERVNAGYAPSVPPCRVPTIDSDASFHTLETDYTEAIQLTSANTGLYRAAASPRATVFCANLNAFIAVPAVPPKYLRWLRQRRAATKEIRNMMLIGRHRNVVHLYEVLEYIQDAKSTMFLVLELVRGGELFDLISSNSSRGKKDVDANSELTMRKFFRELSSGIHYCHANGIAHRDLKPENLLVHTGTNDAESTLKIADFGLSATFALHDDQTIRDSVASPNISPFGSPTKSDASLSSSVPTVDTFGQEISSSASFSSNFSTLGQQALQYLTCGNIEDVNWCGPGASSSNNNSQPSPLKRMTSVVGSPHYVAPEIILQADDKGGKKKKHAVGYDGTKADVWSAGVILYAMLYRSLPFGEDLLRCPRYQSFRKWYHEARKLGGRRSSAIASLKPIITEEDELDMLGPHWFFPSHTSVESRDLIVAMLNPNPDERLSIEYVLQHPWLTKENIIVNF